MATKRKTTRTSPTGIRFDIEKLSFISEAEKLETKQQVVDFLMDNYWWRNVVPVTNKSVSQPVSKNDSIRQPAVVLSTYETYLSEISESQSIQSIELTIAAIKAEKSLTLPEKTNLYNFAKQKSTQFDF